MDETLIDNTIIEETFDDIKLPSESTGKTFIVDEIESQEDLVKAYNDLKAKTAEVTGDPVAKEVPEELFNTYQERFVANNGTLGESDYAELAEKGYTKEFVDTYIAGVQQKNEAELTAIIAPYGTLEDLSEAKEYAKSNWSQEKIEMYNRALQTSSPDVQAIVLGNLIAESKRAAAGTVDNGPILQTKQAPAAIQGYESKADMLKDMRSPLYNKDAQYTRKVKAKLLKSDQSKWY